MYHSTMESTFGKPTTNLELQECRAQIRIFQTNLEKCWSEVTTNMQLLKHCQQNVQAEICSSDIAMKMAGLFGHHITSGYHSNCPSNPKQILYDTAEIVYNAKGQIIRNKIDDHMWQILQQHNIDQIIKKIIEISATSSTEQHYFNITLDHVGHVILVHLNTSQSHLLFNLTSETNQVQQSVTNFIRSHFLLMPSFQPLTSSNHQSSFSNYGNMMNTNNFGFLNDENSLEVIFDNNGNIITSNIDEITWKILQDSQMINNLMAEIKKLNSVSTGPVTQHHYFIKFDSNNNMIVQNINTKASSVVIDSNNIDRNVYTNLVQIMKNNMNNNVIKKRQESLGLSTNKYLPLSTYSNPMFSGTNQWPQNPNMNFFTPIVTKDNSLKLVLNPNGETNFTTIDTSLLNLLQQNDNFKNIINKMKTSQSFNVLQNFVITVDFNKRIVLKDLNTLHEYILIDEKSPLYNKASEELNNNVQRNYITEKPMPSYIDKSQFDKLLNMPAISFPNIPNKMDNQPIFDPNNFMNNPSYVNSYSNLPQLPQLQNSSFMGFPFKPNIPTYNQPQNDTNAFMYMPSNHYPTNYYNQGPKPEDISNQPIRPYLSNTDPLLEPQDTVNKPNIPTSILPSKPETTQDDFFTDLSNPLHPYYNNPNYPSSAHGKPVFPHTFYPNQPNINQFQPNFNDFSNIPMNSNNLLNVNQPKPTDFSNIPVNPNMPNLNIHKPNVNEFSNIPTNPNAPFSSQPNTGSGNYMQFPSHPNYVSPNQPQAQDNYDKNLNPLEPMKTQPNYPQNLQDMSQNRPLQPIFPIANQPNPHGDNNFNMNTNPVNLNQPSIYYSNNMNQHLQPQTNNLLSEYTSAINPKDKSLVVTIDSKGRNVQSNLDQKMWHFLQNNEIVRNLIHNITTSSTTEMSYNFVINIDQNDNVILKDVSSDRSYILYNKGSTNFEILRSLVIENLKKTGIPTNNLPTQTSTVTNTLQLSIDSNGNIKQSNINTNMWSILQNHHALNNVIENIKRSSSTEEIHDFVIKIDSRNNLVLENVKRKVSYLLFNQTSSTDFNQVLQYFVKNIQENNKKFPNTQIPANILNSLKFILDERGVLKSTLMNGGEIKDLTIVKSLSNYVKKYVNEHHEYSLLRRMFIIMNDNNQVINIQSDNQFAQFIEVFLRNMEEIDRNSQFTNTTLKDETIPLRISLRGISDKDNLIKGDFNKIQSMSLAIYMVKSNGHVVTDTVNIKTIRRFKENYDKKTPQEQQKDNDVYFLTVLLDDAGQGYVVKNQSAVDVIKNINFNTLKKNTPLLDILQIHGDVDFFTFIRINLQAFGLGKSRVVIDHKYTQLLRKMGEESKKKLRGKDTGPPGYITMSSSYSFMNKLSKLAQASVKVSSSKIRSRVYSNDDLTDRLRAISSSTHTDSTTTSDLPEVVSDQFNDMKNKTLDIIQSTQRNLDTQATLKSEETSSVKKQHPTTEESSTS